MRRIYDSFDPDLNNGGYTIHGVIRYPRRVVPDRQTQIIPPRGYVGTLPCGYEQIPIISLVQLQCSTSNYPEGGYIFLASLPWGGINISSLIYSRLERGGIDFDQTSDASGGISQVWGDSSRYSTVLCMIHTLPELGAAAYNFFPPSKLQRCAAAIRQS